MSASGLVFLQLFAAFGAAQKWQMMQFSGKMTKTPKPLWLRGFSFGGR